MLFLAMGCCLLGGTCRPSADGSDKSWRRVVHCGVSYERGKMGLMAITQANGMGPAVMSKIAHRQSDIIPSQRTMQFRSSPPTATRLKLFESIRAKHYNFPNLQAAK